MAICGRMKCALFNGWSVVPCGLSVGRKRVVIREKRLCCGAGARLRIDFPGVGMTTAEEEGELEMEGEFMSLATADDVNSVARRNELLVACTASGAFPFSDGTPLVVGSSIAGKRAWQK